MKFLILKTNDPYHNLAVEEYMFEKTQDDVFILWQNDKTVVIGKNQNVNAELDFDFVERNQIKVARRITGGGAVYHDLGNVNYSFISSTGKEGIDFAYFCQPVLEALCSVGLSANLSGRNDIEIDGKKISGNAQCTKNGRTLHHGTLLFDTDLSVLSDALKVDEEKIKSKAIKSTRARVTNIKSFTSIKDVSEFISIISDFVIKKYSPEIIEAPQNEFIRMLEERNSSNDWLFPKSGYSSGYTLHKKKRFDFGTVEIDLLMNGDLITNAKIYGDFFSLAPIEMLESALKGKTLAEVFEINASDYINGMSSDDLIQILTK